MCVDDPTEGCTDDFWDDEEYVECLLCGCPLDEEDEQEMEDGVCRRCMCDLRSENLYEGDCDYE